MDRKYLIITSAYPCEKNNYENVFVHVRAKEYIKNNLDIEVMVVNVKPLRQKTTFRSYIYEGVKVQMGSLSDIKAKLLSGSYEKVLVHFAYPSIISNILKHSSDTRVIVWCHGVDVISWHRRIYNLSLKNCVKFGVYAMLNVVRRLKLAVIIRKYRYRITFVFVSKWLKKTAEKDLFSKGKILNTAVIPNPIDSEKFEYIEKNKPDRLKVLSIRAFNSRNYANDVSVKAILELSKKSYFSELSFTICGKGRLWNSTVKPLLGFDNVRLENRFFTHEQIKELHRQHGVMLMPSRQDTHGISTCEGMSSGLVPVTSNNSAIPEYVPGDCAYLTDDYMDVADAIEDIYNNADKFLELSKKSSEFIQKKCGANDVISKEIKVITG